MARTRTVTLPTPPNDVEIPQYVTAWLGHRDRTVLAHGFTEHELRPTWWANTVRSEGLAPDENFAITLPPAPDGVPRLTRRALFTMAGRLDPSGADGEWLAFLWHVLSWGSGRSRRNNRKRIHAFADPASRRDRVSLLRLAAQHARNGDARSAYSALIRRGGGMIPGLGPGFFTKFLYFATGGVPGGSTRFDDGSRCLILDARVARNLHGAGWTTLPHRGQNFSANWHTDTYVSYCDLLHRWAAQQTQTMGAVVAPDEIERALFAGRDPRPHEIGVLAG